MATKNAPRVFVEIDGTETLLTNAVMMRFAIDALKEVEAPEEVVTKAEQHLAALTKKSGAPKQLSKAAIENEKLAHEVAMVMPEDTAVTTKWIMEHVNGIATSQKCVAVMNVLMNKGRVGKFYNVEGRNVGYKLL
jgi:DNA mismatch repair ATPase MutS